MTVETLALWASLYFVLACNGPFWHAVFATGALAGASGALAAACLLVLVFALQAFLFCVLLHGPLAKPVLALLLVAGAAANHYARNYGTYFDTDMVRNVLQTDAREAGELLSWGLLPSLVLHAGLPMLVLSRIRLRRRTLARAGVARLGWLLALAVLAAGAALGGFQDLSALMRNNRELRHLITPGNLVVAAATIAGGDGAMHSPRRVLGGDATLAVRPPDARSRLLVLVIGETVRAQNWGLNGYARQTTPRLAASDAINFIDVTACGTSTEVSLPCMFSPDGREGYDKARLANSESLLHVLEHAGVHTIWRDNQSGCKGVCTGLAYEAMQDTSPGGCGAHECHDDILLSGLDAAIDRWPGDQVIVLHQVGTHGPAYHRRVPERLRRFVPTCDSDDLGHCSREQVVNSYDNAVLATDDMLADTIALLARRHDRDSALLYISDHGESLGENGLYLHGLPYAIAPDTQKKVPMVAWLSPGMAAARHFDRACLARRARAPASHDDLFHSVLGLLQVRTMSYDQRHDVFAECIA
ncbi:phosphoethanolamine--lipid A transferase [Luteimonas sp. MC1825]|nr:MULTISPECIES: phosphoethanolamine--lipid A transferase [unclassified Luteimonas]MBB1472970.1 phosphoethanolamine--lipid A transferase [Luteimonas sp. MC1782]MBB6598329.1 phosphoethanolamine--lipid A transferase [Luteimonas sp. MC1825]QOC88535.1 phosphoethanolamine--lipid A transferase [Luteimonas sp. MC1825]